MEGLRHLSLAVIANKNTAVDPLLPLCVTRWHYAYNSVLEETVRRRRKMWSWSHIMEHRMMMKRYREAYVKKLDSKKVPADVQTVLDVSSCDRFMVFFFSPSLK